MLLVDLLSLTHAHAQVRMDLQLYRIDDQNYLVDFRNLGYRSIKPSPTVSASPSTGASSTLAPTTSHSAGAADGSPSLSSTISIPASVSDFAASPASGTPASLPPNTADELRSRKPELPPAAGGRKTKATGLEVSSPYLFLECAVRLIVELASPAGGEQA